MFGLFRFTFAHLCSCQRRRAIVPRLEILEDRFCPSSQVVHLGHTLTIQDSDPHAQIGIVQDDANRALTVHVDNQQHSYDSKQISAINVVLKDTDQSFHYSLDSDYHFAKQISVKLKGASDVAEFDLNAFAVAAPANISVSATADSDSATLNLGDVRGTEVAFTTKMTGTNSPAYVGLSGPLEGKSNVALNLQGGPIDDGTPVDASGDLVIGSRASLSINMTGEAAQVGFSGGQGSVGLDGTPTIRESGLSTENSECVVDMSVDSGSTGRLDAILQGTKRDDNLGFYLHDSGSTLHVQNAKVNGGGGNNVANVTSNVKVVHVQTVNVVP